MYISIFEGLNTLFACTGTVPYMLNYLFPDVCMLARIFKVFLYIFPVRFSESIEVPEYRRFILTRSHFI